MAPFGALIAAKAKQKQMQKQKHGKMGDSSEAAEDIRLLISKKKKKICFFVNLIFDDVS